ncbi:MAG: methylenetetrahydrofolate reductase, partial [Bacilli bacterium]
IYEIAQLIKEGIRPLVTTIQDEVHHITNQSSLTILFKQKIKVIAAEVESPKNCDITHLLESARLLKEAGAHLLTVVDSPLAQTRADSLMIASLIKKEFKIDVLAHLTCRDKNQIAIKGGLIAANINNINNVLAISGDAIAKIDRDYSKGVFCFNSINLINYIAQLNEDIFYENPFLIGGALNVNALNFDAEIKRAEAKIANQVDYFITQSIFDQQSIDNIIKAKQVLKKPIIVGLYPVASYKNALFLHNELNGINIPKAYLKQLEEASSDTYQDLSIEYTSSLIKAVFPYCDGFYIASPLAKTIFALRLIDYIKKLEEEYGLKS